MPIFLSCFASPSLLLVLVGCVVVRNFNVLLKTEAPTLQPTTARNEACASIDDSPSLQGEYARAPGP